VNVIADAPSRRIAGYVTLSAAQIERAYLPRAQQRNRPDPLPVTLLGQLAVDKGYQGKRHAVSLMQFALKTALRAADFVGSVGIITHPLDDDVRHFYAKWGFQDLPFDPRRAMMVRTIDLRRAFANETEGDGR
jgi:GNAT superfamily N-acetyltransferase